MSFFKLLKSDLHFYSKGESRRTLRTLLWDRQFHIMALYRLGHSWAQKRGWYRLCPFLRFLMGTFHSCDISFKAAIGHRLHMPHPLGIVIGEGVVVGDDVTIFQHVTVGSHGRKGTSFIYPVVEDHVRIYANSSIVGSVRLGEGAIIGAQSLVVSNARRGTTYAGVPARKLYRNPESP